MLEQSSTARTYTRDAYAPVRRNVHAEVEKLRADSMPAPFHFSNFEESVLDRSVEHWVHLDCSNELLLPRSRVPLSQIGAILIRVPRVPLRCTLGYRRPVAITALLHRRAFRFLAQRGSRRRALPKHSAREQIRSVDC